MQPRQPKLVPISSKSSGNELDRRLKRQRNWNIPCTKQEAENLESSLLTPSVEQANLQGNYEITPSVFDPVPLQCTPVLPRNFFVTGYLPETLDLGSSASPPSPTGISGASLPRKEAGLTDNLFPSVQNVGASVPPHIQRIARKVSSVQEPTRAAATSAHLIRKVVEIVRTQPPNMDGEKPPADDFKMPKHAHTSYSSGLPPKAPQKTKYKQKLLRDPLLHTSVVTPPCPIRAGENQTPAGKRRHMHKHDLPDYLIPTLGMVFKNFEEAKVFFNGYARHAGFGTKVGHKVDQPEGNEHKRG